MKEGIIFCLVLSIFLVGLVSAYSDNYILICGDKSCNQPGPMFGEKSEVYIYMYGKNLSALGGSVAIPGGAKAQITFSGNLATIKTPAKGAYSGVVTYKYNRNPKEIGFKFITGDSVAVIDLRGLCNLNGFCDGNETMVNCPQDCDKARDLSRIVSKNPISGNLTMILQKKSLTGWSDVKKNVTNNLATPINIANLWAGADMKASSTGIYRVYAKFESKLGKIERAYEFKIV